ncbi:PAS domain-containing sensor histidine kinase [Clostridium vincentii]|uniref:histidine kinase n=1 Tax=Clostridium vincentii TaxID=52704 RepID=A0A2T0BA75_9CLOT|nr:ATP-binding protein [Clostridium vincentii]PRR80784.1 Sensor protein ZraS [Clostridium vincentii]
MNINYLFESMMKNVSDSIIITDANGYIEEFNTSTEKIWHYSCDEFKHLHINNLFSLEDELQEDLNARIYKDIVSLNQWSDELCAIDKNKNTFNLIISIYPVLDYNSQIINYVVVSEDIREKKSLVQELSLKNQELKEALKNLKTTQVSMVQEDKLASLGQLSAGIAHEINNPLGFIISNFGTLKKYTEKLYSMVSLYKSSINNNEGYSSDEDRMNLLKTEKKYNLDFIMEDLEELLKDTEDGIERVRKTVGAMRNFAHSTIEGEFEQYDLNDGINNTLVIAKNELKYNSNIETALGELPYIEAQSNEINQVILNIIINSSFAIKEKHENEDLEYFGLLKIATYSDRNFIYCSIEDNGTGISKKNLDKIFEPFFTTKPVGKGTGLGLSIAYDTIKNKHKGELIVESTLGIGTKIVIKLPIKKEMTMEEELNG